jgi:hypothetical protein
MHPAPRPPGTLADRAVVAAEVSRLRSQAKAGTRRVAAEAA